ncbi:BTAD domain-containing putative transcriptional regulator [Gordonia sp. ABSL49_1]|uniref:BTAD domain-containing putative transcriptional regulator n=1 Tax=Gordonia sp. ABSL49_1 TaxID=2920941 RepID=UPI001F0E2017|nr:BTAD domain-containing putative transcriptional regulator [Gordonia sp. ABSL49_1]MCH5644013.1 AAA family ATPase [Gordonia sp. ABSL49_1]
MSADAGTSPRAVSVRMSGTVRVEVDGERAEIKSRRERAVLARLVAANGHVVSTDRLIDDLWNGEPPPKALAGLQVHISNLRRILEPDRAPRTPARILISEAPGYALRLSRSAVDLWQFDDVVASQNDDARERLAQLDAALALWQGEPYGAHAADDWARGEVARLGELHLAAIEQRASAALELGRAADVAATLPSLCGTHPTREELFRLLALAQYRLGRQADALETLRTVRLFLSDELGVDPTPALRDLESAILQHDPNLGGSTTLASAAPPSRPTVLPTPTASYTEFAGREAELEKLTTHADTARHTGLRMVWITAEAGGGKSTLARGLVNRLGAQGWTTAIGHCPEVDGAPTAWAWREIVEALGQGPAADDPFAIARQVTAATEALTDTGALLVLDNVHRADSATLQILRQTMTWLAEHPILVVATYRASEAGVELLATGAALIAITADQLTLAGLSDIGIRQLAADAGLDPIDDTTVALLRSRTDGNPLFVKELAKLVASRGPREAQRAIPSGVREVLLSRVERLPEDAVSVMRLAAVCGRESEIDTLVALWPDDSEDAVLDAIDSAVVAGLLTAAGDRVRFNHVLMHDAIHDSIPSLRRRRLHWRVFEILETIPRTGADELAYHAALGAGPTTVPRALEIVESAARERFTLSADAVGLWRDAVDLHTMAGHGSVEAADPDRTATVHALCELVTALAHAGEIGEARARREQALTLARTVGDRSLELAVLISWRTPSIWTTRPDRLLDPIISQAVRDMLPHTEGVDRARLLVTAVAEFEGNEERYAAACSREAVEIARASGDPELLCAALNARVHTATGPDDREELLPAAIEFVETAESAGIVDYTAVAHFFMAITRAGRGEIAAAHAEMRTALQTATSGKVAELVIVQATFGAALDTLRGNLDKAEQPYQAIAWQLRAAGNPAEEQFELIGALCVGFNRGSIGHLVDGIQQIYDTAPESVAWVYAAALIDAGRETEARAVAEIGYRTVRDYYWSALEAFHADTLVRLQMAEPAAALYDELRRWSGTVAGLNSGSIVFGYMDDHLARLADLIGDSAAAAHHREVAATVRADLLRQLDEIG